MKIAFTGSTEIGELKKKDSFFTERTEACLVKEILLVGELIVARCEYDGFKSSLGKPEMGEQDLQLLIVMSQFKMAEEWLQKLLKRISDKSGEQHDERVMKIRSIFMNTTQQLLEAALAKRSFPMQFLQSNFHSRPIELPLGKDDKFQVKNKGIVGSTTKNLSSGCMNEVMPINQNGLRPIHMPNGPYVYRGGFRMPKRHGQLEPVGKGEERAT